MTMQRDGLPFRLPAGKGLSIDGDVRLPAARKDEPGGGQEPVAVLAHGWLGAHRSSFFPYLAEGLVESGLVTVAFSFSGSGAGAQGGEPMDVDAFAANTVSQEIEDLRQIVTAVFERILPGRERFDIYRIGVLGHDLGASVAFLEAARDTRVKALVALAPYARIEDLLPDEAFDAWLTKGTYEFRDPRTNRKLRLDETFLRDLRARRDELDIVQAAQSLRAPYLVVHGDADAKVALRAAKTLFFANSEQADMEVVAGADHHFGCPELGFEGASDAARTVRTAAVRFLNEKLRRPLS